MNSFVQDLFVVIFCGRIYEGVPVGTAQKETGVLTPERRKDEFC